MSFYDGPTGSGSRVGAVVTGSLAQAQWNASNRAQTVWFGAAYAGVRSAVMAVLANHGAASFSGMNELAFNGQTTGLAALVSFTASTSLVQRPAAVTLDWQVSGAVTSLVILPDVGDVLPLTTGGTGRIEVSPIGYRRYTLVLNGAAQPPVEVIGLPAREKVHLYLLIGQSNMQGNGLPRDPVLDQPDPRVLKFGSRDGMESAWVLADHPLTSLAGGGATVGMGIEFAKTVLAHRGDPELVIGLINHALGASAIQWWAPGAVDNKQTNSATGQNYRLYDEAIQRVAAASAYGVVKGVLWHQGEYNCANNANPDSEPELYAARLSALVDNLRHDLGRPGLPFVCGKLVPASWVNDQGVTNYYTGLPDRAAVEAALADLPLQRANTFCVDNSGLRGKDDDKIHFDAWSQRQLGQRYAGAMNGFYSDPYRLYLGGFYSPAQMGDPQLTDPAADNDADGLANYLEWAFLTDPARAQGIRPLQLSRAPASGGAAYPGISYRYRIDTEAPDYLVEVSHDLATWLGNLTGQPAVTVEAAPPVDNGDGSWTATVRYAAPPGGNSDRVSYRVRVSGP
jgi:hypothetical protein